MRETEGGLEGEVGITVCRSSWCLGTGGKIAMGMGPPVTEASESRFKHDLNMKQAGARWDDLSMGLSPVIGCS